MIVRFSTSLILSIVAVILCLSGCTTTHHTFQQRGQNTPSDTRIPIKIALYLKPQICSYEHNFTFSSDKRVFELGPPLCGSIRTLCESTFAECSEVSDENNFSVSGAKYILVPTIVDVSVARKQVLPVLIESNITLEWILKDEGGNVVFATTINGLGRDDRLGGFNDIRYQSSMQMAIDDSFDKATAKIRRAPGIADLSTQ